MKERSTGYENGASFYWASYKQRGENAAKGRLCRNHRALAQSLKITTPKPLPATLNI